MTRCTPGPTAGPTRRSGRAPRPVREVLQPLLEYVMEGVLDGADGRAQDCHPQPNISMITQLCAFKSALTEDRNIVDPAVLESVFIFCLTWSIEASSSKNRTGIRQGREEASRVAHHRQSQRVCRPGQIPQGAGLLYEYFFDVDESKWVPWTSMVADYVPPPTASSAASLCLPWTPLAPTS